MNAKRLRSWLPSQNREAVLGIIGGLGPLASADFLLSIYDYNLSEVEQQSPTVIMYSDPTFPDRTEIFRRGEDDVLLGLLKQALDDLCRLNVTKIVIACLTIHHLLPRLPVHLRSRVISLVDVTLAKASESGKKHLLLCTTGTRALGIFQSNERWPEAEPYVVLPNAEDQERIHDHIYRLIKKNRQAESFVPFLKSLLARYGVTSFIAGCTEIHRVTRHLALNQAGGRQPGFIDPLLIIARNYKEFVNEDKEHPRNVGRGYGKIWRQGGDQPERDTAFLW